jgi:hypothetical protein
LFHVYVVPPFAVKFTEEPEHIVLEPEFEILATGNAFTTTAVAVDVPAHPDVFVTCTE